MTRLEPTRPRGLLAKLMFFFIKRKLGRVPTPLRIAAHHPRVLGGTLRMEWALQGARRVPARLKSLVQIRVASLVGCPF